PRPGGGCGANELSRLVSATDGPSQRSLTRARGEQWQNIADMARAAKGRFRLIGTVSVAFGCPFEGHVDPGRVVEDVQRFHALGVEHVALGDTIGTATPQAVRDLFRRIKNGVPIA